MQRTRLKRIGGTRRVLIRSRGLSGSYDPPPDRGLESVDHVFVGPGRVTLSWLLARMNGADVLAAIDRGAIATRGIYASDET